MIGQPVPEPRERILTLDEMARFLAAIKTEHVFRYTMIALNTLARPQAVTELTRFQVDWEHRFIALNPAQRPQTKKFRPTVPITETLWGWLQVWDGDHFVTYRGRPVRNTKKAIRQTASDAGLPEVNRYALRHTMASELRKRGAPMDQIAIMMGHKRRDFRTTERYTKYDPAFLHDVVTAIDSYMDELQNVAGVQLIAPSVLVKRVT